MKNEMVCNVCKNSLAGKDYKVISLRGVNHSSDTAKNGLRVCCACLASWTPDDFSGKEKKNDVKARITVNFKALSDNTKGELMRSHFINDNCTDWINGTGSIKRTLNKLSKLHYSHDCNIAHAIVEIIVDGETYFNVYKPSEFKAARFDRLESFAGRERNGFLPVK